MKGDKFSILIPIIFSLVAIAIIFLWGYFSNS